MGAVVNLPPRLKSPFRRVIVNQPLLFSEVEDSYRRLSTNKRQQNTYLSRLNAFTKDLLIDRPFTLIVLNVLNNCA